MTKFLLLLGPSGVGKSTIIRELRQMDKRFIYISPYITRSLRKNETDKVHISDQEMDLRKENGEFLTINNLYGIRYATPIEPITKALGDNLFPVLDWPISRMEIMTNSFPGQLYTVYVCPPSWEELQERMTKDQRNKNTDRLKAARKEFNEFQTGGYEGLFDFQVISYNFEISEIAKIIYLNYLQNI